MIKLSHLKKKFGELSVLDDVSLHIEKGDIYGILGLSGAGKSTLIRCINLLEKPTSGEIYINDVDITKVSKKELLKMRTKIGMIFQGFNLLEQKTVLQNVLFPLEITKVDKEEAKNKALELLKLVGLEDKVNNYPSQLSGGEKQRVAIARALTTNPDVILSDEATSALDPNTTQTILALLKKINKEYGITIIVITHEMKVIEQLCDRVAIIDKSNIGEIGNVEDVFISPKTEIGKELIFGGAKIVEKIINREKIRLIFDNVSSYEPIVSNMILQCNIPINILDAQINYLDGLVKGEMLIQISEDEKDKQKIIAYLNEHKIEYREEA